MTKTPAVAALSSPLRDYRQGCGGSVKRSSGWRNQPNHQRPGSEPWRPVERRQGADRCNPMGWEICRKRRAVPRSCGMTFPDRRIVRRDLRGIATPQPSAPCYAQAQRSRSPATGNRALIVALVGTSSGNAVETRGNTPDGISNDRTIRRLQPHGHCLDWEKPGRSAQPVAASRRNPFDSSSARLENRASWRTSRCNTPTCHV